MRANAIHIAAHPIQEILAGCQTDRRHDMERIRGVEHRLAIEQDVAAQLRVVPEMDAHSNDSDSDDATDHEQEDACHALDRFHCPDDRRRR